MLIPRYEMNPHNEYFAPNSERLFPRDFKNEDVPNAITCMRKSNNFMQSNCSSPLLKFSSINSINPPVVAIWRMRQSKRPFLHGRKGASGSWAEPYFACHLHCKWGFAYPPGILYRVFTGKKEENRIPGGILYRYLKAYPVIQSNASLKIKRWKILM